MSTSIQVESATNKPSTGLLASLTNTLREWTGYTDSSMAGSTHQFPPILQKVPDDEKKRYKAIQEVFVNKFGSKPDFFARAPGRVNLIGEHIDYCGYSVLPMAIQQDVVMAVGRNAEQKIVLTNTDDKYSDFTTDVYTIEIDDTKPQWHHYFLCGFRGVVECESLETPIGMNIVCNGTIPPNAGLSSSSALVCCSALATMHANGFQIPKVKLADVCMRCERYIGTQGGGMDQAICFLAQKGMAKLINFNPLSTEDVKIPNGLSFVIGHCGVEINKAATSDFNLRVVECRVAAKVIAKTEGLDWRKFRILREVQEALKTPPEEMRAFVNKDLHSNAFTKNELLEYFDLTTEEINEECMSKNTLNEIVFELHDRARHVYGEAGRVLKFQKLATKNRFGDEATLGNLMDCSHESCRQLYKCSVAELDELVEVCRKAGTFGARLTGAGWGGCVVALIPTIKVKHLMGKMKSEFYSKTPERQALGETCLFATSPGPGALLYEPKNV